MGREREGDTEPDARLKPTNPEIMTWAEVGHLTEWATQMPQDTLLSFEENTFQYNIFSKMIITNKFKQIETMYLGM